MARIVSVVLILDLLLAEVFLNAAITVLFYYLPRPLYGPLFAR